MRKRRVWCTRWINGVKKYYESYTGSVWGALDGYDLCIETDAANFDAAVEQICAAYENLF